MTANDEEEVITEKRLFFNQLSYRFQHGLFYTVSKQGQKIATFRNSSSALSIFGLGVLKMHGRRLSKLEMDSRNFLLCELIILVISFFYIFVLFSQVGRYFGRNNTSQRNSCSSSSLWNCIKRARHNIQGNFITSKFTLLWRRQ